MKTKGWVTPDELEAAQKQDPLLGLIIEILNHKQPLNRETYLGASPEQRVLLDWVKHSEVATETVGHNQLLVKLATGINRIIVPRSLRTRILAIAHAGHPGIQTTLENVKRRFTWPYVAEDTAKWVRGCTLCLSLIHI